MKTIASTLFALCLCITLPAQQTVHPFSGYAPDTSQSFWTALSVSSPNSAEGRLLIGAVAQHPSSWDVMGTPVGDLKLLFCRADQPGTVVRTVTFPGKAHIYDIQTDGTDFWIAGGFVDTLVLGNQVLTTGNEFHFAAFVARIDTAGNVQWAWGNEVYSQNCFVRRLRIDPQSNTLTASGLYSDVYGWVGVFAAATGTLRWLQQFQDLRTISDAAFVTQQTPAGATRRLWFTGSCDPDAVVGGDTMPTMLPNTGYMSFLAHMDTSTGSAEVVSAYPHITFDFDAELILTDDSPDVRWKTTVTTDEISLSGLYTFIESYGANGHMGIDTAHFDFGSCLVPSQGPNAALSDLVVLGKPADTVPWAFTLGHLAQPGIPVYNFTFEPGGAVGAWHGVQADGNIYLAVRNTGSFFIDQQAFVFPFAQFSYGWVLLHRNPVVTEVDALSSNRSLYPNPARDWVVLPGVSEGAVWEVVSMTGQAVAQGKTGSDGRVDISGLPDGMYLLKSAGFVYSLIHLP